MARESQHLPAVQEICTDGLNLFRLLVIYIKPVLPALARQAEAFLRCDNLNWNDLQAPLLGHTIASYEPLMTRVEPARITQMIESSKPLPSASPAATSGNQTEIDIEAFQKVELRIAQVIDAEAVDGADRLVRLTLDAGAAGRRSVIAGIRESYPPADLVGRKVVLVANLKARKMRFGTSDGMVLAASGEGPGIFLVSPDDGAAPGMRVK